MFGSTILDLAVGLIFTFLMISLVTSAATEAAASACKWRAATLLDGVKDLLNDPNFTGLARSLYNHAFVNARADGTAQTEAQLGAKPSYIDPKQFANALIDVAALGQSTDIASMQAQIANNVPNQQLRTMLNGIVTRAGGNINRVRDEIAAWFDGGMNCVAGAYKRKTQIWSFVIALVLAGALNVDTIKIANTLWQQPMITKSIGPPSGGKTAVDALSQFEELNKLGLPFGWNDKARTDFSSGLNWLFVICGWLITAIATLFGAPFWFNSLQKFVQLRGAGSS